MGGSASLLLACGLALSACAHLDTPPTYAKGVAVDCAGKQDLSGSGSTAQANAMTHFITRYQDTCSGKPLTYTANGSGAGVEGFIGGKTDFGGRTRRWPVTSTRLPSNAAAGPTPWNLPVVFGPAGDHLQPQRGQRPHTGRAHTGQNIHRRDHTMGQHGRSPR